MKTPNKPGYYLWSSDKVDGWKPCRIWTNHNDKSLWIETLTTPAGYGGEKLSTFVRMFKRGDLEWQPLYTNSDIANVTKTWRQQVFNAGYQMAQMDTALESKKKGMK